MSTRSIPIPSFRFREVQDRGEAPVAIFDTDRQYEYRSVMKRDGTWEWKPGPVTEVVLNESSLRTRIRILETAGCGEGLTEELRGLQAIEEWVKRRSQDRQEGGPK